MQKRDAKAFIQGVEAGQNDRQAGQPCYKHDPENFNEYYIFGYNLGWEDKVKVNYQPITD